MTSLLLDIRFGDPLYELYLDYIFLPPVIRVAVVFIILATLTTLLASVLILIRRRHEEYAEGRRKGKEEFIDNLILGQVILNPQLAQGVPISNIEFDGESMSSPLLRRNWIRLYLLERILHYKRNVAGDTGLLLSKFYRDLGLEKYSLQKLNSTSWHKQARGIREHMIMDVVIPDVALLPLTNSRHPELRTAARNAYVQLSKNDPFKFFDIATEPLLPWDQLELFKTITTNRNISIPNFSRWISYSTNPSVISFCLKLIVHYNQQTAIPALIALLNTKDHQVRAEAIECLGKLAADQSEERLIAIYPNQPVSCQIEILKTLGLLSSGQHLEFLKQEFLYSQDYDIRKYAALSIIRHHSRAKDLIADLEHLMTEEHKLMLRHVANPLIKN